MIKNFTVTSDHSVNICFYGLNRSLASTIGSINNHVFGGLASIGIEYKVYGFFSRVKEFSNERSGEFGAGLQDNETDLIEFNELQHIDQDAFDDSISWPEVFEFGDFYSQILGPADFSRRDSTAKNIFRSLFCLKSSYSLVPESRRQFPTIFMRPDLEILSEINWSFYLGLLDKKPRQYAFGHTDGVALVPAWHSWDGLNDRFALCSSGNASAAYASRFDGLLPYIKMSRKPIHPESFLLHILQASRVEILPLISTCMSRIRANGEAQSEDFAQGQKIYNMQTETLSCLHKLLHESRRDVEALRATVKELEPLKEGFDLTMTQLVQVQEELEHYYLMSKHQQSMLEEYSGLNSKSMDIISNLI